VSEDAAEYDREVTRRSLEEGDFEDDELVIVHLDDDPDNTYHDYEQINRLNVALGTLTTADAAEEHGFERCSECYE